MIKLPFALTTLSPIVIGEGDQTGLSPYTDFVIHDGQIHYLDHARIHSALAQFPEALDRWVQAQSIGLRAQFDLGTFLEEETGLILDDLTLRTFRPVTRAAITDPPSQPLSSRGGAPIFLVPP